MKKEERGLLVEIEHLFYMLSLKLSALHSLCHQFHTTLFGQYYCSHFIGKDIEAQKDKAASQLPASPGNLNSSSFIVIVPFFLSNERRKSFFQAGNLRTVRGQWELIQDIWLFLYEMGLLYLGVRAIVSTESDLFWRSTLDYLAHSGHMERYFPIMSTLLTQTISCHKMTDTFKGKTPLGFCSRNRDAFERTQGMGFIEELHMEW